MDCHAPEIGFESFVVCDPFMGTMLNGERVEDGSDSPQTRNLRLGSKPVKLIGPLL